MSWGRDDQAPAPPAPPPGSPDLVLPTPQSGELAGALHSRITRRADTERTIGHPGPALLGVQPRSAERIRTRKGGGPIRTTRSGDRDAGPTVANPEVAWDTADAPLGGH